MDNRYSIFLTVLETGSFTHAAETLGYSQSAVSQSIHSLENEMGIKLLVRNNQGLALTNDGERLLPCIRSLVAAEQALAKREKEVQGFVNANIRIGTFTSVSRNILPVLMKEFREEHPSVTFELIQGEYDSISEGILSGKLDFGFVNPAFVKDVKTEDLFEDEMVAVLPKEHPLSKRKCVSLKELESDPFIELDEGVYSVALEAFRNNGLKPNVCYKVTDDYSILAMVRQSLGYSLLYQTVLSGFSEGVKVVRIREPLHRSIALAWRDYDALSISAKSFVRWIQKRVPAVVK